MPVLIKLIGAYIIIMGIFLLLNPKVIKRIIAFFTQGKRIYLAGILRFLVGAILLLGAAQCRLAGVIIVLGILTFIAGALIFVLGIEKVKTILNWWEKRPAFTLRLWGIVVIALGTLLIYSV